MIAILSYYNDGSGKPEVDFIEDGPDEDERITMAMLRVREREIVIFKIGTLDSPPVVIKSE